MPDLSAWAADLGRQFPVAAVILLVCWFAVRYLRDQQAAHETRTKAQHPDQVRVMEELHRQQVEMLTNWNEDLRKERDRLNRELAKRRK